MGLDDLMKESGVEKKSEQQNQTENKKTTRSPATEVVNSSASSDTPDGHITPSNSSVERSTYDTSDKREFGPHDAEVDYDEDVKACPRCLSISEPGPVNSWTCENPNCPVNHFTRSWNERGDGEGFLQSVDWVEIEEELQDILRFD